MHKFHYLYKITCLVTGKYYIGIHSCNNLNDNYWGSGSEIGQSIKQYGRKAHQKIIIEECTSREHLLEREAYHVDAAFLANPLTMNIVPGGNGPAFKELGSLDRHREKSIAGLRKWLDDPANAEKKNASRRKAAAWWSDTATEERRAEIRKQHSEIMKAWWADRKARTRRKKRK